MPRMTPPIEKLVRETLEAIAARFPRRLITRNGTKNVEDGGIDFDGKPYMFRSYFDHGGEAPDGEAGLFLHKFVSSDEIGELHSHPWKWSSSFILSGTYRETRAEGLVDRETNTVTFKNKIVHEYKGGDVNFIRDIDFHRVELLTPEVWTLFMHGPRVGSWGFAKEIIGDPVSVTIVKKRTFKSRPEQGLKK